MDKILDQGQNRNCGVWATMFILQNMGISFDIARFSSEKKVFLPHIEKLFVDSGLIKGFHRLDTPKQVDIWLRKGQCLLTSTTCGNFNNPPNVTFDGTYQHFFVICGDMGDRWKCANSWGENWGDKGYFYIKKSDFHKISRPRRVIK